ncbi:MAG: hypothetical protein LBC18_01575 [Opitutaceae bacterium]|jgi:hypothetical protein|nr:hypothetical protein [Opitutaceae bacterium]
MARKQVTRDLPSLQVHVDEFCALPDDANRQAAILDHLRKAALKMQKDESQPFYSMRQIAALFKLPLRTVAIAYEQLEKEGVLNRIRGSKTVLEGRASLSRDPVRAIVGLPIWLHAIVVSPYSRMLYIELEERLRSHGFVADIIFFRDKEATSTDFPKRLLQHRLDYVIWHTPHPLANQTLLSLKDHGIKQILVHPSDNPTSINLPMYLQDWQRAYAELAATWQEAGIRQVIVPEPLYLPSKRALRTFSATLEARGLKVSLVDGDARTLAKQAGQHAAGRCAVAFIDQLGAEAICNEESVVIEQLLKTTRMAFCRGPIRMPYFHNRKVAVDVIGFSPVEVAQRVVGDLRWGIPPPGKQTPAFTATFRPLILVKEAEDLL